MILLDEEMRRVLEFCRWKEDWWIKQVPRHTDISPRLAEGLRAYAEEQADLERRTCSSWTTKWACARELAQPILLAASDGAPATARQEVPGELLECMEFIEEEHDADAADSDFEG